MRCFLLTYIIFLPIFCPGQDGQSPAGQSIESTLFALLDLISVEKGEGIDTASVRMLFHPAAQLTMLSPADSSTAETVSLDTFLDMLTDPYYEAGYEEKELHKHIDEYGGIAQVFQRFSGADSEGNTSTGMNSYQLARYHDRWWIVSLLWTLGTE